MRWTKEQDAQLLAMRAKRIGFAEIASALDVNRKAAEHRWYALERQGLAKRPESPPPAPPDGDVWPLEGRVRSLDELLEKANVDLTVWEVERWTIGQHEMGAALRATGDKETGWSRKSDEIEVTPLFHIKAWLRRIKGSTLAKLRDQLLADIRADTKLRAKAKPSSRPRRKVVSSPRYMLEVNIADIHIGKLAWAEETGENYDSSIAKAAAESAVADLLSQARHYPIERILLPIGNDFFHYDNLAGTTTGGTMQDRDSRYHKMFRTGRALASWMVEACAQVAPVHVLIVPGNHDEISSFTLGEVLDAEFKRDPRVTVENTPRQRKYHRYGKNLIGFDHGKDVPDDRLVKIMPIEEPTLWAETTHREWHLHHLHHLKKREPLSVDDNTGVTVRRLRSLSGTDSWHARNGYVGNPRGAEAFLWRYEGGLRAHFFTFATAA